MELVLVFVILNSLNSLYTVPLNLEYYSQQSIKNNNHIYIYTVYKILLSNEGSNCEIKGFVLHKFAYCID